jgi:tetratricopeptide (TPR) repeat protein
VVTASLLAGAAAGAMGLWAATRARSSESGANANANASAASPTATASRDPRPAATSAPTRIAVLGFRDLSGRADRGWLATALSELIGAQLAASDRVRVAPAETVARLRRTIEPGASLREAARSDYVVTGSFVASETGTVELVVRLEDGRTGEPLLSTTVVGDHTALVNLASRAADRLLTRLGVARAPLGVAAVGSEVAPSDPAVAALYFEGLDQLRAGENKQAIEIFRRAAALAPDDPFVQLALATALAAAGMHADSLVALEAADRSSSRLSADQRAYIEARLAVANDDLPAAAAIFKDLFARAPDDVELGMRLWGALAKLGRFEESAATLAILRGHASLAGTHDLDMMELQQAAMAKDHARALAIADRAAERAEATGARSLIADMRTRSAMARWALGDVEGARADSKIARSLNAAANGHEMGNNPLADLAVRIELEAGSVDEAIRIAGAHAEYARRHKRPMTESFALLLRARAHRLRGDLAAARKDLAESERLAGDHCNESCDVELHVERAELALAAGRADDALRLAGLAVAVTQPHQSERTAALSLRVLALASLAAGRPDEAVTHIRSALVSARLANDVPLLLTIQITEARILASTGDASAADRLRSLASDAKARGLVRLSASALDSLR